MIIDLFSLQGYRGFMDKRDEAAVCGSALEGLRPPVRRTVYSSYLQVGRINL